MLKSFKGGKCLSWSLKTLDKHCSGQNMCIKLFLRRILFYGWFWLENFSLSDTIPYLVFLRLCETLPFSMHNELFFLNRLLVSDYSR